MAGLGFIAIISSGVFIAAIVLSAVLTDTIRAADDGPNMPQLVSVKESASNDKGMIYDESSVVRGIGDVSIKGSFGDHAVSASGWMKGTGSMSLESLRSMNKNRPMIGFTQKSDLVFEGGQLKGETCLESPLFYGRIGASVTERFNMSHVDKSETDLVRSINRSDNALAFNVEQAFNGTWDIKTLQGWSFNEKKSEQQYSGSFQTTKNIEFQDRGKK